MGLRSKTRPYLISKVAYGQVEALYPLLYSQVFKVADPAHQPAFVYIGRREDEYVGFVAAYAHNLETVYIQYAGMLPEFQGYPALPFFKQAFEAIHEEYRFILTVIENTNVRALKGAMTFGFRVIGIRMATDGSLMVELLKEKTCPS